MANGYTADGTYWTGRLRNNGYLEVLRLRAADLEVVESWGPYYKYGSAVAAAAQLGYQQGRADALKELEGKVYEALASVGLEPMAVESPDDEPAVSDSGISRVAADTL